MADLKPWRRGAWPYARAISCVGGCAPPDGLRPPPAQFLVPGANHLPIYRQRHLNYPLRREWIDKGLERQTIALAKGGA